MQRCAGFDDRSDEIEIRPAGRDAPCVIGWAFWTNEEDEDALEH